MENFLSEMPISLLCLCMASVHSWLTQAKTSIVTVLAALVYPVWVQSLMAAIILLSDQVVDGKAC
ncbi:hypothetical protein HA46_13830 [Pantoea septica]|uniref:Uncharacterized protein n=1 Tax=Pantoea septica TaxID=472695 RepID=A0ABX3UPZ8_9GAMM|nr:hypothetical protein HA46_13830 [Pantoea septica]